jgi:hypothetical protein
MPNERRIGEKLTVSKYTGKCTECKCNIGANVYVWYNTTKKTARHKKCSIVDNNMKEV